MPSNYKNGVIYKLYCQDTAITDLYVGSTCSYKKRIQSHKARCTNPNSHGYNIPLYQFIRDHGGWNNWKVAELEKYSCLSRKELMERESSYFTLLSPSLNKNINSNDRREELKLLAKSRITCDCGLDYSYSHKTEHFKSKNHLLLMSRK